MARPRRVISMDERRALLLRRSELSTLAQLPNWDVFCAVIEQEIEDIKRVVMARAMGAGMSLEEQAFNRGRVVGLRAARSIPARALNEELTESSPRHEEVAAGE